jgi:glycosyltransferase involved in cell wall biosynthesis
MPLRIVLDVRHALDFGIGTYIRNLVRAMGAIDHENKFVLVGRPSDLQQFPGLPGNFETIAYARSGTELIDHVAFPMFLRSLSADLYHLPLNMVPLLMPKPYVVTIHDMSPLLFPEKRGVQHNRLLPYQFRRGLMRADRIIAVSAATRRDVQKLLGIPDERIRQIYNAPDPRFLEHGPDASHRVNGSEAHIDAHEEERKRILERYQIDHPFLLYAGNIRTQKNIPRLVEAFAVLRGDLENHAEYKDLRLIIIGDEIFRYPAVRRAVIQTRMEHAVRFLGFVPFDTLRIFYESTAAFVFPSLYEGFGLPPLEAMACGAPVVTSSVSSLPEVVGDAAMIVNPENVFDIARGIRDVLLDEDLRSRLVAKGFDQVKRFSWEQTARAVLATYGDVVAESRRS